MHMLGVGNLGLVDSSDLRRLAAPPQPAAADNPSGHLAHQKDLKNN